MYDPLRIRGPLDLSPETQELEKQKKQQSQDERAKTDDEATRPMREAQKKNQILADQMSADAKQFRDNLPGYTGNQISSATDAAKRGLVDDIMNVKRSANSRGLLYSGIEAGGEADVKGRASSKLAGNIQGINTRANAQADYKDAIATAGQMGVDAQNLGVAQMKAQSAQSTYQAAIEQQQAQQAFFSSLFEGAGKVGGIAAGLLL